MLMDSLRKTKARDKRIADLTAEKENLLQAQTAASPQLENGAATDHLEHELQVSMRTAEASCCCLQADAGAVAYGLSPADDLNIALQKSRSAVRRLDSRLQLGIDKRLVTSTVVFYSYTCQASQRHLEPSWQVLSL